MLKIYKPKFWDKKNFFSILFYPLSLITLIIIFFKKKFSYEIKFELPVICVGNIYVGGTGKTPTSILISKELFKDQIKAAIVRKFYKSHEDEYNQIKNYSKNLIVDNERLSGIRRAEKSDYQLVILDDGLQDYKIKKDLSIVCFHQNQLAGNELILPAGPLREHLNSLRNVNIVLINGDRDLAFEEKILKINKNLKIFYSYYKPMNINNFRKHKLLAIAGIANPENFFELLEANNLHIEKKLIFPDHYKFNEHELKGIIEISKKENLKIIMTEKDFFKIDKFNIQGLNYLQVSLEISEKEKFMKEIKKII